MADNDIRFYCNTCQNENLHNVIGEAKTKWSDDKAGVSGEHEYYIAQCGGCQEIAFAHFSYFSEHIDYGEDEFGNPVREWLPTKTFYPPRLARQPPSWVDQLDPSDRALLSEIYSALQNDSRSLATMGTRALLDRIMMDRIGDLGSFRKKVDKFVEDGHMASQLAGPLLTVLDAGSAAGHRGYVPDVDVLNNLFDAVESIVQSVCVIPGTVEDIKKQTPERKKGGA